MPLTFAAPTRRAQSMAKDMGSMFSDGGFGFQGQRLSRKQQVRVQDRKSHALPPKYTV